MQIRASRRGSLTPQTRDVQILKCCVCISLRILTTDSHPHSPLPTQAPSRSHVSSPSKPGKLGHWRTINGCSCGAWSQGDSDRTRPSALYYSICSLCSAGQLAECQAWVNDPRQSASVNFRGRAVRVSLRISRILADLRSQAAARMHISAADRHGCWRGESHAGMVIINATTVIWSHRHTCHHTHLTREVNGSTRRGLFSLPAAADDHDVGGRLAL